MTTIHPAHAAPSFKNPFKTIGLIGRQGKTCVSDTLKLLADCLLPHGYHLIAAPETFTLLNNRAITLSRNIAAECDLLIVVGGDGSILQAAHLVANYATPILGINRGRLGFLADICPENACQKVLAVLAGDFIADTRFLLQMQIIGAKGVIIHQDVALNDIVLHAGKSVHTIDYQLTIDGLPVYRQHADGLIVATPTGSTAYNLSAGGSIMHPSLPAICLAPMYPHTLSSRPIVVPDVSIIEIGVHKDNRTQPMISCDGKTSVPLNVGEMLKITKAAQNLTLLHPAGYDFYEACRTKLNWSLYSDEFALETK